MQKPALAAATGSNKQNKKRRETKNMELLEDWNAEVSTECQCIDEAEDGTELQADTCQGCNEWMLEGAHELLEDWQRRNNNPEALLIQGHRMNWDRRNGYALIRDSANLSKDTLNKLMLNADFTLTLKLEGNTCKITRTSHDELGATFTLEPFAPCQGWSQCEAVEGLQEYDGVTYCAWCYDLEQANQ
jgi:hypothetical protein